MYDAIKDPEKTCNGLFQAGMILPIGCNELAIIYVSLAAISGAFWFYYVYGSPWIVYSSQKAKKPVAEKESVFDENKKRFHFATAQPENRIPFLDAVY